MSAPTTTLAKARQKETRNIRVSITFKIGSSWRGTRSRDFPGRKFGKEERDILQRWAVEFRRGEVEHKESDTHKVVIPATKTTKQRRFPTDVICRHNAFRWFRETQERLIYAQMVKDQKDQTGQANNKMWCYNTLTRRILKFGVSTFVVDHNEKFAVEYIEIIWDRSDLPTSERVGTSSSQSIIDDNMGSKKLSSNGKGRRGRVAADNCFSSSKSTSTTSITSNNNSNSNGNNSEYPFFGFLTFGEYLVPTYIIGNYENGSYLRANNIPVGTYVVNGARLTICAKSLNGEIDFKKLAKFHSNLAEKKVVPIAIANVAGNALVFSSDFATSPQRNGVEECNNNEHQMWFDNSNFINPSMKSSLVALSMPPLVPFQLLENERIGGTDVSTMPGMQHTTFSPTGISTTFPQFTFDHEEGAAILGSNSTSNRSDNTAVAVAAAAAAAAAAVTVVSSPSTIISLMPSVMSFDDPGYVDVQWEASSTPQHNNTSPVTLMFGTIPVKLYPTEPGRGIFKTCGIASGKYNVNNIFFEVTPTSEMLTRNNSAKSDTTASSTFHPVSNQQQQHQQQQQQHQQQQQQHHHRRHQQQQQRTSISLKEHHVLPVSSHVKDDKDDYTTPSTSKSSSSHHGQMTKQERLHDQRYIDESKLTTLEEVAMIGELRGVLGDLLTTGSHSAWPEVVGDISLTRFLRGCNHDVSKAAFKFREHIDCRQRFGFDRCRRRLGLLQNPATFDQENMLHGDMIAKTHRMEYNVGHTVLGDPIAVFWAVSGALSSMMADSDIGYQRLLEFVVESFVRRQIQLDCMSREQGRLVRLVIVVQASFRGWWRLFGTCRKKNNREREFLDQDMGGTLPFFTGKIHVVGLAWAMRLFISHVPGMDQYTLKFHGENYSRALSKEFTLKGLSGTEEFYSQYDAAGTRIIGFESDVYQQERGQEERGGSGAAGNTAAGGCGPLSYFNSTFGSTPRQFSLNSHYGRNVREIVIQVNPSIMTSIRWRFEVHEGKQVDFCVFHVVEDKNGSTGGSSSTNLETDQKGTLLASTGATGAEEEGRLYGKHVERQMQAYLSGRDYIQAQTFSGNSSQKQQQEQQKHDAGARSNDPSGGGLHSYNSIDQQQHLEKMQSRRLSFSHIQMHEVCAIPTMKVKLHEGTTKWTEQSGGLIILRWSYSPEPQSYAGMLCGPLKCCQQMNRCVVRYEVEGQGFESTMPSSSSSSLSRRQQKRQKHVQQQQSSLSFVGNIASAGKRQCNPFIRADDDDLKMRSDNDEMDEKDRFFSLIREIESVKISRDSSPGPSQINDLHNALRRRKRKQPSPRTTGTTRAIETTGSTGTTGTTKTIGTTGTHTNNHHDVDVDEALFGWRAQAEADAMDTFMDEMDISDDECNQHND